MSETDARLRDRLVEAGAELVADEGTAAVSLREIAGAQGYFAVRPGDISRLTLRCCQRSRGTASPTGRPA
jgi:hypothetical protein